MRRSGSVKNIFARWLIRIGILVALAVLEGEAGVQCGSSAAAGKIVDIMFLIDISGSM
ncbi:MAG: hypothetical protein BJ554DRAFT_5105 [Olpidium bornovanus]|uniref:VWA domain-containing protein n=1 Tax=Olpidium bornovanus TaxID=278681 RepID=A0A8H8A1Z7_9FUNG|nr:MAG: hypothetical protein BJ554DRAFT_5105 [Olpidium bornovanus]